jgi:hypothetical protein
MGVVIDPSEPLVDDPDTWRQVAAELHPMVNAGLPGRVHTCAWQLDLAAGTRLDLHAEGPDAQ